MTADLSPQAVARRLEELRALCELTDYLHGARFVATSRALDESSPAPRIRPVETRDLDAVRRVFVDTWHHTYDAVLGAARVTEITDDWHSIASLRAAIGRADRAFLLVEEGGAIVAAGSARRAGDVVRVGRLYVLPGRQGTGFGTTLLEALVDALLPGACVELEVAVTNTRAITFYESRGFTLGERDGDSVVMRRRAR
jgi:ribosomal protein S18 acetylase RimI-like enzyme